AEFVGLEHNDLILSDLQFNHKCWRAGFALGIREDGGIKEQIRLLPKWKRILLAPFQCLDSELKHESRHAAHYALFSKVYEENPLLAHGVIKNERLVYYNTLINYKFHKADLKMALQILDKALASKGQERDIEKIMYYSTISTGLAESFANDDNSYKHFSYGLFAFSGTILAAGILRLMDSWRGNQQIEDSGLFLLGTLASFVSLMLVPGIYYPNRLNLTTKNLERFTTTERKYLLAFPAESGTLEKRCEKLRKYGFEL
ncbi:MAG: hypothetical protein U9Q69_05020, partial [Nanoarchaeota archaeon]|nr:hypothetical protein [Nanoarchaeota archaeon]